MRLLQLFILTGSFLVPAFSATVHITNPMGRITVTSEMGLDKVRWTASSATRKVAPEDIEYSQTATDTTIICHPGDHAPIDLEVFVPHTTHLTATTSAGDIFVTGLIFSADLKTETGAVKIATTWELTRLKMLSTNVPGELRWPQKGVTKFVTGTLNNAWALATTRPNLRTEVGDPLGDDWAKPWEQLFSTVHLVSWKPKRIELVDMPLPLDSWIREPSEAGERLKNFWQILKAGRLPLEGTSGTSRVAIGGAAEGDPQFRSDVRLVTLAVPIYDKKGHPTPGLTPADFELEEDGVPQKIVLANAGETPFNLVLLLDLSKSTYITLPMVKQAARDFVKIAQPRDRVAIHVLSNSIFEMVSSLTNDREHLLSLIDEMPDVSGGSPIYDCLLLSGLQQPLYRSGELSAIVILTDGMDNQFERPDRGSVIPYGKFLAAVKEWPIPIYTLLFPYESPQLQQQRGRPAMRKLSEASGGRMFDVYSLKKLADAYARVAEELRSVYTIGYYPTNQAFDGTWRTINLRAKRSGLTLRTRPGYAAW